MNDAATSSGPPPSPTLGDAMRFAFGTLTVLPVRLRRWTGRRHAADAVRTGRRAW
ncbi:hypothetical protein SRIMM317S_02211 [Streptomyces rimosus subsp. rimosus]